ncbi:hypothetical protein GCM10017083_51900 [Thalassobaculum fulvum]|uniref:Uncharacterized protein n=1 Tax=Thalassobaculum fulvum TaxID=1633335 RepID=A0A918XYH5_9PROT|nr:hypothetical protein GCM10017083_51900 [Thalassobaculum fulvum]
MVADSEPCICGSDTFAMVTVIAYSIVTMVRVPRIIARPKADGPASTVVPAEIVVMATTIPRRPAERTWLKDGAGCRDRNGGCLPSSPPPPALPPNLGNR